eukprot:553453-Amphidinium_carterae.1
MSGLKACKVNICSQEAQAGWVATAMALTTGSFLTRDSKDDKRALKIAGLAETEGDIKVDVAQLRRLISSETF